MLLSIEASLVEAVEKPAPGLSYRPTHEDHQALLAEALAFEEARLQVSQDSHNVPLTSTRNCWMSRSNCLPNELQPRRLSSCSKNSTLVWRAWVWCHKQKAKKRICQMRVTVTWTARLAHLLCTVSLFVQKIESTALRLEPDSDPRLVGQRKKSARSKGSRSK